MAGVSRVWIAAAVACLALAGCTDDDTPEPDPPATSDAGSSTQSSSPSSPSTDGSTSASPEPTVTPAAGLELQEETSRLNAPEGPWAPLDEIVGYSSAVARSDTGEGIALSDRENFADPAPLDEQVRVARRLLPKGAEVERLPDLLLDGEPAYSLRWTVAGDRIMQHDIGTQRDGRVVYLHFDLLKDDSAAADAVVAAVVASFAWR